MFFHHASVIDNVNPIFFRSLFCFFIVYSKLHPYYLNIILFSVDCIIYYSWHFF